MDTLFPEILQQLPSFVLRQERRGKQKDENGAFVADSTISERLSKLQELLASWAISHGAPLASVELFERGVKPLKLTKFGSKLFETSKAALDSIRDAISPAVTSGSCRIGFARSAAGYLGNIAVRMAPRKDPEQSVTFECDGSDELVQAVINNAVQFAVVLAGAVDKTAHALASEPFSSDGSVLALEEGHKLSKRPEITLFDLQGESLIWFPQPLVRTYKKQLEKQCPALKRAMRTGREIKTQEELYARLLNRDCVAIVPANVRGHTLPRIVTRDIKGTTPLWEFRLIYRVENAKTLAAIKCQILEALGRR